MLSGCTDKCLRHWSNSGSASKFKWRGHMAWQLDLRPVGDKYGIYYQVPCQRVLWTWFNSGNGRNDRIFRGEIHRNEYGERAAYLFIESPENLVWSLAYDPSVADSTPFDDLYEQHAIAMVNHGNDKGRS